MITAVHPQLFFREWGSGYPVVVLHGLFGASDNWATVSKLLAVRYRVIAVDLRNHGLSFHDPIHRYPEIAADVARLLDDLGIISASVIGHSMGGKVAMQFAADFPHMIDSPIEGILTSTAIKVRLRLCKYYPTVSTGK